MWCVVHISYIGFSRLHSFSVTIFTLGFLLFFNSAANKLDLILVISGQNLSGVQGQCSSLNDLDVDYNPIGLDGTDSVEGVVKT